MPTIRMTHPTALVLQALEVGYRYGFDIAQAVGLRPGSVYQILHRLEEAELVSARWEDADAAREEGRPSRRYYALRDVARPLVEEARRRLPAALHVPASAEGPA